MMSPFSCVVHAHPITISQLGLRKVQGLPRTASWPLPRESSGAFLCVHYAAGPDSAPGGGIISALCWMLSTEYRAPGALHSVLSSYFLLATRQPPSSFKSTMTDDSTHSFNDRPRANDASSDSAAANALSSVAPSSAAARNAASASPICATSTLNCGRKTSA